MGHWLVNALCVTAWKSQDELYMQHPFKPSTTRCSRTDHHPTGSSNRTERHSETMLLF